MRIMFNFQKLCLNLRNGLVFKKRNNKKKKNTTETEQNFLVICLVSVTYQFLEKSLPNLKFKMYSDDSEK